MLTTFFPFRSHDGPTAARFAGPILAIWLGAIGGPSATVCRGQDEGAERPNVLFILTDDQRHDALSIAGHPQDRKSVV